MDTELKKCSREGCQPEISIMPDCCEMEYRVTCWCGRQNPIPASLKEMLAPDWNQHLAEIGAIKDDN